MANTVWIVIAVVVALVVIGAIMWTGRKQRDAHRRAQADEIRERLRHEDSELHQRESIAAETEARARAAKAEADAKSAQAERLQTAAEAHRSEANTSRAHVEQQRERAEQLDPRGASGRSERQSPN